MMYILNVTLCNVLLLLAAQMEDFIIADSLLTISPGGTQSCFIVHFTDESFLEYDESFMLHLEAVEEDVSVINVLENNTWITILNNDSKLQARKLSH